MSEPFDKDKVLALYAALKNATAWSMCRDECRVPPTGQRVVDERTQTFAFYGSTRIHVHAGPDVVLPPELTRIRFAQDGLDA